MANCVQNTGIVILNSSILVKNIKFASNWNEVALYDISSGTTQCSNDINSIAYFGISIVNNELVFSNAFPGLGTNINSPVSANPVIKIGKPNGALEIIGIDDSGMGFSVTRVNVRYDSSTNSIKFQI